MLAAAAIHLALGGEAFADMTVHTGYSVEQLQPCLKWMRTFSHVLEQDDHYVPQPLHVRGRALAKVPIEDAHNIQSHCNPFELLEQVLATTQAAAHAQAAAKAKQSSTVMLSPPPTASKPTPKTSGVDGSPAPQAPPRTSMQQQTRAGHNDSRA